MGTNYPFFDRPFIYGGFAVPLTFHNSDIQTYYLRIVSDRTKIVPLSFRRLSSLLNLKSNKDVIHGAFFGVLIGLFFYNLFLFIGLKDRSYLFYILSLLSTIFVFSATTGHGFQYLAPDHPKVLRAFFPGFSATLSITIALFAQSFLNIKAYNKWVYHLLTLFSVVSSICLVLLLFVDAPQIDPIMYNVLMLEIPCLLGAGFISWKNGNKYARYYIFAWVGYTLGGFALLARDRGLLPINFLTSHGAEIGAVLEAILLSLALSSRYQQFRKEKEAATKRALEIQQQANEKLESKVKERTHQLRETNDELVQINHELNTTLDLVEEERAKSEELLLNILPQRLAQELKDTGKASPRFYEEATILFADFKGFTQISEVLSTEELVSELDTLFQAFDDIVTAHGLEKIKTIGDAYMCAGGLPVPNDTHALDAVKAGLAIQKFVSNYQGKADWQLRVGIHTGPVAAGVVGKRKFAYDIWGDAVNLAARMEVHGVPTRVNISTATMEKVKGAINCEYRGQIEVKNKGMIEMYFVQKPTE